jgi:hypothetical protein
MASNSKSFNANSHVSLGDLRLLQSNVKINNTGEFIKVSGIPNIRLTSPILYAKTSDYGQSDIAFKVTKEDYDSYLAYYNANIQPELAAFYPDPNAIVLGRVNKKKKNNALEVKHGSFYEDNKSDNGGMICKFRVNKSSLLNLVMDDGTIDIVEFKDIKWGSMAEAFGFVGVTKDRDGVRAHATVFHIVDVAHHECHIGERDHECKQVAKGALRRGLEIVIHQHGSAQGAHTEQHENLLNALG